MLTVKSIIHLFVLFAMFQLCIISLVDISQSNDTLNAHNEEYITFLNSKTNIINTESQSKSLLDDLADGIAITDLYGDNLLDSFFAAIQVGITLLTFIFELAIAIIRTPEIIMDILLYNFIGLTAAISFIGVLVNVIFYTLLFYIVFRRKTN